MINYLVLALSIVVSFLSMYFNSFLHFGSGERTYYFLFFLPGTFFSGFLIFLHFKEFRFPRLIVYFIALNIVYLLALFAGIASWGVLVPLIGAFAALSIRYFFYFNNFAWDHLDTLYFILGFISGGIGLGCFFLLSNDNKYELGFGLIVALWQLVIGVVSIKHQQFSFSMQA